MQVQKTFSMQLLSLVHGFEMLPLNLMQFSTLLSSLRESV